MTKTQYRKAIAALGLSQVSAAHVLGIDPRTSRRYALGEAEVPMKITSHLEALLELKRIKGGEAPKGWEQED